MNEIDIKFLISQAVDGETLSDQERSLVAKALKESPELRVFEAQELRLREVMGTWPQIGVSPDWEQSMNKRMVHMGIAKEAVLTKFRASHRSQYVVLCVLIALTVGSLHQYVKRGVHGRLKSAADDIGDQFSPGNTDYSRTGGASFGEPYYLRSNYTQSPASTSANMAPEIIDRKIVRNVNMNMKVEDGVHFQTEVQRMVRDVNGIIESSDINRSGHNASGIIVLKVLPKHLESILDQIKTLGVLQSENASAEDVTGQYVDTQGRLNSLKAVRDRLTALLAERSEKIKDVLEVERELARVTGEIEAMEGRLKVLAQTTAMATVTVKFYEQNERPSRFLEGVSFKKDFRTALESSIRIAASTVGGIIVVTGFLLPLVAVSLVIWGIVAVIRKFIKK